MANWEQVDVDDSGAEDVDDASDADLDDASLVFARDDDTAADRTTGEFHYISEHQRPENR